MRYTNCFADGSLWDRTGRPWRREAAWLDPGQAAVLLDAGASWLVQWCGEGFAWSDEIAGQTTAAELLTRMVTRERARRLRRRSVVPTVVVAEHWRSDDRNELVVFYEGAPAPRASNWFV